MTKIDDHIQDFVIEHNNSEYIQWYLISFCFIESKFYTENTVLRKKSISQYKCNINFTNKACFARILGNKEVIDIRPDFVEQDKIPMIIYTLIQYIRPTIFNYHVFAKDLNITPFVENANTVLCLYM